MKRSNFIKSLIGIPFIGAIASDLVAKESVKEKSSFLIKEYNSLNDIKNPVVGQLIYSSNNGSKGFHCYYESGWRKLATRSFE